MMTVTTLSPLNAISASQTLLQSGGALLIIIFLLIGIKKILSSLPRYARHKGHRYLEIEETLVIGPRERLIVVRTGKQRIVLGTTSQQIHYLCALAEPSSEHDLESAVTPQSETKSSLPFCARTMQ